MNNPTDSSYGLKDPDEWDEHVLTRSFFNAVDSYRHSKGAESNIENEFMKENAKVQQVPPQETQTQIPQTQDDQYYYNPYGNWYPNYPYPYYYPMYMPLPPQGCGHHHHHHCRRRRHCCRDQVSEEESDQGHEVYVQDYPGSEEEVEEFEENLNEKPLYSWGGHVTNAQSAEPIVSPVEDKVKRTRYPTPPGSHHPIPKNHGFAPILVNEVENEEEEEEESIEGVESDSEEVPRTPPQFFNNGTPVPYPVTPLKSDSYLDILPRSDTDTVTNDELRSAAISVGFPLSSIPKTVLEQIGLVTVHAARHISSHDDTEGTSFVRPGTTPAAEDRPHDPDLRMSTAPGQTEASAAERALSLALLAWYSAGYNTGRQQAASQRSWPWWQFWKWFY